MTIDRQKLLAESFLAHAEHHAVLDSTQFRARALAEMAETKLPALVVADQQTAGRGRGSNRWWTGEGSLAFSLLVDPAQFGFPRRAVPRLSLAAGVAIVDAVAPRLAEHPHQPSPSGRGQGEGAGTPIELSSGQQSSDTLTPTLSQREREKMRPLGLHWPNDIYVGRGKLAGVLVEVLPDGRHIIGVGLNSNNTLADAPEELRDSIATLLDLTGRSHDHTELLLALLENLHAAILQLAEPVETLGQRFDLLCRQRGEMLTVYQGDNTITGRCMGVAPDGALLLETPSGVQAILSGTLRKKGEW